MFVCWAGIDETVKQLVNIYQIMLQNYAPEPEPQMQQNYQGDYMTSSYGHGHGGQREQMNPYSTRGYQQQY